MDIRDYASMVDAISTEEKEKKVNKPKVKPTIEVEYSDMVDFVLARKTKNTKRLLMVMPSKGKVCVSDGRTAEEVTDKALSEFFAGNSDIRITIPNTTYMNANNRFDTKESVNRIRELIKHNCVSILKYGVLTEIPALSQHGCNPKKLTSYETELQFALRLMQKVGMKMSAAHFTRIMGIVYSIKSICGCDNARYFIESMINSKIEIGDGCDIREIMQEKYKLNPRRVIEYFCYDLPEQGILELDGFYRGSLKEYRDYLNMEYSMYGEVRDKYPRYLRTQHDIAAMKFQLVKDEMIERNFRNAVAKYIDLAYSDKEYTISIPKCPADLVEEGRRLCHCVASYAESVSNGNTMIVFCRKNSNVEDPYCTIEVRDGEIVQARGLQNRNPDKATIDFIRKWAKAKSLRHNLREEVA